MEPTTPPRSFVRSILPWIAAAGMLLLYIVTLNKEVTLGSIYPAARGAGLDWHPTFIAPFTWLVTLPVRYLPAGIQLISLNFLGALCGALALGLLARSVAILPHDRTEDQRIRDIDDSALLNVPLAWLPTIFAVLLLGLQRSFWENSIICTGETIDSLLIAYVIRALLEFRLTRKDAWIWKASLVYGMGMANNFAFIAYAPALLIAVIWLKKLQLFEFRFLTRLFLFGILGLCLYFVLPIVQSGNDAADTNFWQALRINLGYQKQVLLNYPRWRGYWLGGYPLVLLLMISIKWAAGWGDSSRAGNVIGTAMAHLMHLSFLALAIWMAMDLPASPRHLGLGLSFLGSHLMAAVAAGYIVGYFLLVFRAPLAARGRRQSSAGFWKPLSFAVSAVVCVIAIAVPVRLAATNWKRVAALNAPDFRGYAAKLARSLPPQPAVILSDDPLSLYAVAMLGGGGKGHMFIETGSLTNSAYLRFLQHQYGSAMPPLGPDAKMTPVPAYATLGLFEAMRKQREIYYLHPSFGYILEMYYQEPVQFIYRLRPYEAGAVEAPPLTEPTIAEQTQLWNGLIESVLRALGKKAGSIPDTEEEVRANADALMTAQKYSRALDWLAVELQRSGKMKEAVKYLDEAIALNTNNASAYITREANLALQNTGKRLERLSDRSEAMLRQNSGVESLLNMHGPVDEAAFRYEMMQLFARTGLWRQAAQNAMRAIAMAPDESSYSVALANVYLGWGQPDKGLALAQTVKSKLGANATPAISVDLARTEAAGRFAKGDFAAAETLLKKTVEQFPEVDGSYAALSQLYLSQAETLKRSGNSSSSAQMYTNALMVAEQQIKQQPTNAAAYFNHGTLAMYLPDYARAAQSFSKVLELDPKNYAALLNRAIANLQGKKLDAAQADYETLLGFKGTSYQVYYGLAEIAYQKKEWSDAKKYYEGYLRYSPSNSEETKFVKNRLAEVRKK